MLSKSLLLVAFFLFTACQTSHKIVITNEAVKSEGAHKTDYNSNAILGVFNWDYVSNENTVCAEKRWHQVSSQQAPLFSALNFWATVGQTATLITEVATNTSLPIPWLALTFYSQEQTSWYCGK